jgi:CRISPR-associated protein Csm4
MEHRCYRLTFGRVHFGTGALDTSAPVVLADTLFSALAQAALAQGGEDSLRELVDDAQAGRLALSDTLPWVSDEPFVPKPVVMTEAAAGDTGTAQAKRAKAISHVPLSVLADWLRGCADLDGIAELLGGLGVADAVGKAAVRTGGDAEPFRVGTFSFGSGAGLWLIAEGDTGPLDRLEDLLDAVGLTGIGGDRSSGLGRFTWAKIGLPVNLACWLNGSAERYVALSVCLPGESESDEGLLEDSSYLLVRRGGFIASAAYADTPQRKRDLYKFAAGSVFARRFAGDVFDVSNGGSHPVFSYAKPVWMGLP